MVGRMSVKVCVPCSLLMSRLEDTGGRIQVSMRFTVRTMSGFLLLQRRTLAWNWFNHRVDWRFDNNLFVP